MTNSLFQWKVKYRLNVNNKYSESLMKLKVHKSISKFLQLLINRAVVYNDGQILLLDGCFVV